MSSSMQSSVGDSEEDSTKARLLAEFNPETIAKCKRLRTTKYSGDTPLHKVCRTGQLQMARYLILVENASVNIQDHAGWTPLHEACCANHVHVVEFLLKSGADVNVSSRDGTKPIHDAVEAGNLEVVKLLVHHGADPMVVLNEKTLLEGEIRDFLELTMQEKTGSQSRRKRKSSSANPASVKKKPTRASRKGECS